jgi:hypothetical protein
LQIVNDAVFIICHARVSAVQLASKITIVIKPRECSAKKEQKAATFPAERFEVGDCRITIAVEKPSSV